MCNLIRNVLNDEIDINRKLCECKQKAIKTAKIKEITYKSIEVLVKAVLKDDYAWKLDIYSNINPRLVINKTPESPFAIEIDETNYVKQIMELPTKLHGEK